MKHRLPQDEELWPQRPWQVHCHQPWTAVPLHRLRHLRLLLLRLPAALLKMHLLPIDRPEGFRLGDFLLAADHQMKPPGGLVVSPLRANLRTLRKDLEGVVKTVLAMVACVRGTGDSHRRRHALRGLACKVLPNHHFLQILLGERALQHLLQLLRTAGLPLHAHLPLRHLHIQLLSAFAGQEVEAVEATPVAVLQRSQPNGFNSWLCRAFFLRSGRVRAPKPQVQAPAARLIRAVHADLIAFAVYHKLVSIDVLSTVCRLRRAAQRLAGPHAQLALCRIRADLDQRVAGPMESLFLSTLALLRLLIVQSDSFVRADGHILAQRQPAHVARGKEIDGLALELNLQLGALGKATVQQIARIHLQQLLQLLVMRPWHAQVRSAGVHHAPAGAVLAEVQLHAIHANCEDGDHPVAKVRSVDR
mmetsp:Transcript_112979/g.269302  ORF Transcript_112979/g.269302 Transcript_112979/m.269302 type:complete len:418 (+) Transcript_112979:329-1582(+)